MFKPEGVLLEMPFFYRRLRFVLCAMLLLAGCVTLPSDFKEPGVSLVSITPQIKNLFAPEFDVVLRVTNPNREALDIAGLSYTVHLQGNKLIEKQQETQADHQGNNQSGIKRLAENGRSRPLVAFTDKFAAHDRTTHSQHENNGCKKCK